MSNREILTPQAAHAYDLRAEVESVADEIRSLSYAVERLTDDPKLVKSTITVEGLASVIADAADDCYVSLEWADRQRYIGMAEAAVKALGLEA